MVTFAIYHFKQNPPMWYCLGKWNIISHKWQIPGGKHRSSGKSFRRKIPKKTRGGKKKKAIKQKESQNNEKEKARKAKCERNKETTMWCLAVRERRDLLFLFSFLFPQESLKTKPKPNYIKLTKHFKKKVAFDLGTTFIRAFFDYLPKFYVGLTNYIIFKTRVCTFYLLWIIILKVQPGNLLEIKEICSWRRMMLYTPIIYN